MKLFKPSIDIIIEDGAPSDYNGPRWRDLRVGDGLTYPDGSLFMIDARAIDDGEMVTYLTRCVVPPEDSAQRYGDLGMMSCYNNHPIPDGCAIVKATR